MRISDWSSDVCSSDLRYTARRSRSLIATPMPSAGTGATAIRDWEDASARYSASNSRAAASTGSPVAESVSSPADRQSVAEGKRGSVRVALGDRRRLPKKSVIKYKTTRKEYKLT